jgi:heme exporter protein D
MQRHGVSFSDFLAMGGYAAYVWPAFGITAVVMIAMLWASRRALKAREAELDKLDQRRGAARAKRAGEPGAEA